MRPKMYYNMHSSVINPPRGKRMVVTSLNPASGNLYGYDESNGEYLQLDVCTGRIRKTNISDTRWCRDRSYNLAFGVSSQGECDMEFLNEHSDFPHWSGDTSLPEWVEDLILRMANQQVDVGKLEVSLNAHHVKLPYKIQWNEATGYQIKGSYSKLNFERFLSDILSNRSE